MDSEWQIQFPEMIFFPVRFLCISESVRFEFDLVSSFFTSITAVIDCPTFASLW